MDYNIQRNLKRLNSETSSSYDLKLLFKLAKRKLQGHIPNNLDFSHYGRSNCSSRIAQMFNVLDLEINRDVHFSQIEPSHFVDSSYFDLVGEWKKKTNSKPL